MAALRYLWGRYVRSNRIQWVCLSRWASRGLGYRRRSEPWRQRSNQDRRMCYHWTDCWSTLCTQSVSLSSRFLSHIHFHRSNVAVQSLMIWTQSHFHLRPSTQPLHRLAAELDLYLLFLAFYTSDSPCHPHPEGHQATCTLSSIAIGLGALTSRAGLSTPRMTSLILLSQWRVHRQGWSSKIARSWRTAEHHWIWHRGWSWPQAFLDWCLQNDLRRILWGYCAWWSTPPGTSSMKRWRLWLPIPAARSRWRSRSRCLGQVWTMAYFIFVSSCAAQISSGLGITWWNFLCSEMPSASSLPRVASRFRRCDSDSQSASLADARSLKSPSVSVIGLALRCCPSGGRGEDTASSEPRSSWALCALGVLTRHLAPSSVQTGDHRESSLFCWGPRIHSSCLATFGNWCHL